jgi:hypothetical protein
MLERDFPGAHIGQLEANSDHSALLVSKLELIVLISVLHRPPGPEPTTDRFVAVMYGKDERTIPGNALAADASRPFTALTKFGMAFLNKCQSKEEHHICQ